MLPIFGNTIVFIFADKFLYLKELFCFSCSASSYAFVKIRRVDASSACFESFFNKDHLLPFVILIDSGTYDSSVMIR